MQMFRCGCLSKTIFLIELCDANVHETVKQAGWVMEGGCHDSVCYTMLDMYIDDFISGKSSSFTCETHFVFASAIILVSHTSLCLKTTIVAFSCMIAFLGVPMPAIQHRYLQFWVSHAADTFFSRKRIIFTEANVHIKLMFLNKLTYMWFKFMCHVSAGLLF